MLESLAKFTFIGFGLFFIFAGFLMLFQPQKVRSILRKAGSTSFINYAELSIRMIPGIAFIIYAENSKFPIAFELIGWFILISSLILMIIPRKLHHQFSTSSADLIKPLYFQLIAPLSLSIGCVLIYLVI